MSMPDFTEAQVPAAETLSSPRHDRVTALLAEIDQAVALVCRSQRLMTRVAFGACHGTSSHDAVDAARRLCGLAHDNLARLREDLKRLSPRAWRVHTYGLSLVLEAEAGASGACPCE